MGQRITFTASNPSLSGYFAGPASRQAAKPGLVVIQEWWGLGEGFVALTLDRALQALS